MSAVVPDEGLPLAVAVLAGERPELHVGLLCTSGPDVVPPRGARLSTLDVEPHEPDYQRQPIVGWTPSRPLEVTADEVMFGPVTVGRWRPVTGFLVADAAVGGRAMCYVNFDSGEAENLLRHDDMYVVARLAGVSGA